MAAVLDKEPEIVDESDGDEEITEDAYDVLESALCGEYGSDGHAVNMSQSVKNDVKNAQRAAHKAANIGLCQDTRATTEQVLDPRTRLILFKLLQRNAFTKLEGCLSTGKEAEIESEVRASRPAPVRRAPRRGEQLELALLGGALEQLLDGLVPEGVDARLELLREALGDRLIGEVLPADDPSTVDPASAGLDAILHLARDST